MKLKSFLIPFLFCSVFFLLPKTFCADPPAFNQIQNLGIGVNGFILNCSNASANCFFQDNDFTQTQLGTLYTGPYNGVSYGLYGTTSNYLNQETFKPGYIYVYTLQIYDNSINLEYLKNWSWAINTGYDSDYGGVNKYADIKRIELTKGGNNYSINIYFTVNTTTRYFRVSGRGPYSLNTNVIFNSKSAVKEEYPLLPFTYADEKYYFRYANYGFSAMTDYEYQNYIKQQEIANNTAGTNDKLDNIYDTITDPSLNTGELENSAGWLPAGPVDSILNLPLSLYQNLLNTLQTGSRSCPSLNINLPYVDEVLTIPCLSDIFNRIEGLNVFWTWVGTIAGAFILFNYLINLYKWVDNTLTMRENNHFGGY